MTLDLSPTETNFDARPATAGLDTIAGVLLFVAALVAIVWANSPWAQAYTELWSWPITIGGPGFALTKSLFHWINDGLMALFFFVVGLEIKRELLVGDLSTTRSAALPVAAALGGMLVPALLYASANAGHVGAPGWGIPMATDIAFVLGVFALLGSRVPPALRVFIAALAIADDLGAVLVIAAFYTSTIVWSALGIGGVVFALLVLANIRGVRHPAVYAALGLALWLAFVASGVHPTVAGVLTAAAIPARTRINASDFVRHARGIIDDFAHTCAPGTTVLSDERQQDAIDALENVCEAAQAPLLRLEHALSGIVSFGVMPLFALANAGVSFSRVGNSVDLRILIGVAVGLIIGKPIGIFAASWIAVRTRIAELPTAVHWSDIAAAAVLGGIGFTMSLFITGLAFGDGALAPSAKIGIFAGSLIAGTTGWLLLRYRKRPAPSVFNPPR